MADGIYEKINKSEMIMLINIGIFMVFWSAIINAKQIREEIGMVDSKELLFKICPRWLSAMTGFLIIYALISFIFFLFKRYHPNSTKIDFLGFSGHWMALYSLALAMLYSCQRLKKQYKL